MKLKQVVFSVPTNGEGMHHLSITKFLWDAERACKQRGTDLIWNVVPAEPNTSTRNIQANTFHDEYPEAGALCFCDSDAIPDVPSFLLLLDAIERDDVDICYGWSLINTDHELRPNVTGPENAAKGGGRMTDTITPHKAPGLYEITGGACGSHCMIVKRRVITAMFDAEMQVFEDEFYKVKADEHPDIQADWSNKRGTRKRGHDYLFSRRASDMGFRVWLDNRVYWGHVKAVDLRHWYGQVHAMSVNLRAQYGALDLLRSLWGNEDWTASSEFLMRVASEAVRVPHDRAILELGSGLSTAVLARCHPSVVALEADPRDDIEGATVLRAPLEDYGEYEWYARDAVREALSGKPIGMLVVDGPAGSTRGGRMGCIELRDKLAPGAVVMFDDVNRAADAAVVEAWSGDLDMVANIMAARDGRQICILRMPGG